MNIPLDTEKMLNQRMKQKLDEWQSPLFPRQSIQVLFSKQSCYDYTIPL